ncbi:restriction endonuclease subunit S [Photobacterium leiognathi]|uniref:restriction endonuclease subunit S n=1 Tax=Photobacterium leiognathi TaxID=553611 RepID=UPI0029815D07|nr:restriction endonuclease subunit S [Photobacterium leiognathi]
MSWLKRPLRELVTAHYGKALKKENRDENGESQVFGSAGFVGNHNESLVHSQTIIVGRKGSVGKVIWAPEGGWVIDTAYYLTLKESEQLDWRYLYYALSVARLEKKTITTSIPGLNRDDFYDTEIPLPPLEEQKRIAAILDKADAIRQKRKQAIDLADEFLRSVFLDMFGDPVKNPKGWEVKPLRDVVGIVTGNTPSRKEPENYGDEIEWIKSDNINTPSHFLTSAEESLSEPGLLKGRAVNSGAVLMTCIAGSLSCIGNIAIADRRVSFNQQINALVPKDSITTEYLYALMLVSKQQIQDSSTNSMKGMVSKGTLGGIEFPIAPERKQMDFVDFFNKYLKMLAQSDFFHNQSNIQFNSLSQKAFSGQL